MCDDCQAHAAPAEREPTLEELIAAQAADDADPHAPRHKREVPATDLNARVSACQGRIEHANGKDWQGWWVLRERAIDHRCSPRAWQEALHAAIDDAAAAAVRSGGENRAGRANNPTVPLIIAGMGCPWGAAEAQYRPEGGPCPGCGDVRLDAITLCAVCSATRQNPTRWPMQAQDIKRAKRPKRAKAKV